MPDASTYVPGRGPMTAQLVVLGEAPGRNEVQQKRPFVGASGWKQERWMRAAGVNPDLVRYENVYPFYPEGGNIETVPLDELAQWREDALVRIDAFTQARVIVPVGNTALYALTGKQSISNWRGSVLSFTQSSGRMVKVIPTIHPAAILYRRKDVARKKAGAQQGGSLLWEKRCLMDWRRIAGDLQFPDLRLPVRKLDIHMTEEEICCYVDFVRGDPTQHMTIDIETIPDQRKITCVSFACSQHYAISIPFDKKHYEYIKCLCELPNPKVLQNGFYDYVYLKSKGITICNYARDTRSTQHYIDPLESGSLGFMGSIYTREPYYKPDGEEEEVEKFWSGADWYELLEYNAKDAAVTYEVDARQWEGLTHAQRAQYGVFYTEMFLPLLDIMLGGIRVERERCGVAYTESRAEALAERNAACVLVGRPLFKLTTGAEREMYAHTYAPEQYDAERLEKALRRGKRTPEMIMSDIDALTLSTQEIMKVLREWGVAIPRSEKNASGETLDDTALMGLKLKWAKRKPQVMKLVERTLAHRRARKLSDFFKLDAVDPDGYMRCTYKMTTVTSRLSSQTNCFGTGRNLQNVPQKARRVFVPDPGQVFVVVDMSQAEARDVYARTHDAALVALARSKPWDVDIHTANAARMFEVSESEVTHEQRQDGKIVEHGTNYGGSAWIVQAKFIEAGINKSLGECKKLVERKFADKPGILDWQERVRRQLLEHRALTNAWGRVISLECMPFEDETYKFAYAWLAQSDIGMHMNLRGVKPFRDWRLVQGWRSRLVAQEHDGMTASVEPGEVWEVVERLRESLEQPIDCDGIELSIPMEVKVSNTWCTEKKVCEQYGLRMMEFKQPPTRSELEEGVAWVMNGPGEDCPTEFPKAKEGGAEHGG